MSMLDRISIGSSILLNAFAFLVLPSHKKPNSTQKSERQNVIAILHPLKLAIYSLVTVEGAFAEHGKYLFMSFYSHVHQQKFLRML